MNKNQACRIVLRSVSKFSNCTHARKKTYLWYNKNGAKVGCQVEQATGDESIHSTDVRRALAAREREQYVTKILQTKPHFKNTKKSCTKIITNSKAQTKHATLHACFFNICNSFFKAKRIWIKTAFLIPRCAKTQVQLHCFPLSAFSESCRFCWRQQRSGNSKT